MKKGTLFTVLQAMKLSTPNNTPYKDRHYTPVNVGDTILFKRSNGWDTSFWTVGGRECKMGCDVYTAIKNKRIEIIL
jgi:hypothetical protein